MTTPKEALINLIAQLPDSPSADDLVRMLAFHVMVQRGLADEAGGRIVSHAEMGRRIRSS